LPDTALLVMDFQNNVVDRYGTPEVLEAAGRAVGAARAAGVPVIFARVAFRPGFPEAPEVHRVLTAKVFPQQATVMDVEQWVSSFPPSA